MDKLVSWDHNSMQVLYNENSYPDLAAMVKELRNRVIKDLLVEESLKDYLFEKYKIPNPSARKLEFIKRALHELLTSSVDLAHYGQLLIMLRESDQTAAAPNLHLELIDADVKNAIRTYIL